uniref:Uncharacterized protein n=1 Tax=Anguilla anguilla TaxID=7936 RepID=A0A0E9XMP6_ANGAN
MCLFPILASRFIKFVLNVKSSDCTYNYAHKINSL